MKRKLIYLIFMLFAVFMVNIDVKADDESCPLQPKTELRQMASNISITYVPSTTEVEYDDDPTGEETDEPVLDVYVYNMNSYMNMEVTTSVSDYVQTFSGSDPSIYVDGAVRLRMYAPSEVITLKFKIYGSSEYEYNDESYDCSHTVLKQVSLTLPKYNYYSDRTICNDIRDFYLCQRYITYDIDGDEFMDKVQEYKDKLNEKADEESEENNTSVVSKTVNNLAKYKFVVAGVIVLVGIITTVIVVKKKRSAL